jgi:hypothetical protein
MAGNAGCKTETFTIANNLATNVAALTATSGIDITNARGVTGVLDSGSGHTITSGSLRCYVYVPTVANAIGEPTTFAWTAYNDLDITTLASTVAERYFPFGDKVSYTGVGRICWLPDTVAISAGTTVNITLTARRARS